MYWGPNMVTQRANLKQNGSRSTPLLAVTLAWCVGAVVCAARGENQNPSESKRLVYQFDFDERADGNLETVPKYWEPLRMQGFPGFADGRFDETVGHSAPPSFRLESKGRNVAYEYGGPELTVREAGNYRVIAYLRPDQLKNARTCLCAFFRDRHGNVIFDTFVRSAYISSSDADEDWVPAQLLLPDAPTDARTIGLAVWVLQESTWNTSIPSARDIRRVDVAGGVWIDDIRVVTLPRVLLETSTPGNVLTPTDQAELVVRASDHEIGSMAGELTVWDATGAVVMTRELRLRLEGREHRTAISVEELPEGWYSATLSVTTDGAKVLTRYLSFARVSASVADATRGTTSFGISMNTGRRSPPLTELSLLRRQLCNSVKIPVWSAAQDMSPGASYAREHDVLLQELLRRGFAMTAVLAEIPMSLAGTSGDYSGTTLELLGDSPSLWQDHLAAVAAPYASTYRWWQVGADGDSVDRTGELYLRAVRQVRDTLGPYILLPRMTASVSSAIDPQTSKLPVEQVTITIRPSVSVDRIAPVVSELRSQGYDELSALVESHDDTHFDRLGRLANWAQRLIAARHSGASVVYARPTWQVRDTVFGPVTEPREEFILLRTLADVLRDSLPGPRVPLVGRAECLAFNARENETILALWDPAAPPEGTVHTIQLGAATEVIDLWGQHTPLMRDKRGRHRIRLTNMPVLVRGVERWLIDFRSSFSIVPDRVQPGQELVEHRIESTYFGETPVMGRAALRAPDEWRVTPRTFSMSYSSGEPHDIVQAIRYSHREPEGVKQIPVQVLLDNSDYYLEIPLHVEIVHDDLQVRGAAIMEGDVLIIRHFVSNKSSETINFRGSIAVPGKMRQYRPFTAIAPGEMQHVEYRIRDAGGLAGRQILLGLREIRDNPRVHNLELTVP